MHLPSEYPSLLSCSVSWFQQVYFESGKAKEGRREEGTMGLRPEGRAVPFLSSRADRASGFGEEQPHFSNLAHGGYPNQLCIAAEVS